MKNSVGKVFLVGAGPGDTGLITVKGLKILKEADVIIYDHLVNQNLLDYARNDAKKIDAGKQVAKKKLEQKDINKLLIREASKGNIVARLKGGDPFIFGRGGEETAALSRKGIPFEVIPGISSAIAAPAYAGIPLTYRGIASSVAIVTGHEDPAKMSASINFEEIARSVDTIACLMGVGKINTIIKQIRKSGRADTTPVAIIERGTLPRQRVITGTLKDIIPRARKSNLKPPSVIVIGDVVQFHRNTSRFDIRPLTGKTIVVTRAQEQAETLASPLENAGASVIIFPTIKIAPTKSLKAIDKALGHIEQYDYIVFTSVNGVKTFFLHMSRLEKDIRTLDKITVAALGVMTAKALQQHLIFPKIIPSVFTSRHLAEKFKHENLKGKKVLFFRSAIANNVLPEQFCRMGAQVERVAGYTVRKPHSSTGDLKRLFKKRNIDFITFTSPSTFTNFIDLMKGEPIKQLLRGTRIAAIGPVTRKEIMKQGLRVAITSKPHTVLQLAVDIITFHSTKKGKK